MDATDPFVTPPRISSCKIKYRNQDDRKTLTPDDIRKRSERREEFLAKRRSGSFDSAGQLRRETVSCRGELPLEPLLLLSSPVGTHSVLKDALEKIQSTNSVEKLKAVQEIRFLTSLEENAPLDLLVRMGFIRPLVALLSAKSERSLQFESAWALCNIAGGDASNTLAVVADGALRPLIELFHSSHMHLVYQAVWAVGNIVADNGHFRNLALENGLLEATLPFLQEKTPLVLLKNFGWLVVNMCRTKNPPPTVDLMEILLPKIVWMVNHEDHYVKVDAVWSLAYLSDEPPELADLLVQHENILKSIENIPATGSENVKFLMGAVRLLGNLLSGTDAHCEAVIRAEFVKKFPALLNLKFLCVQKETLMCLANVAAGSAEQIQAILDVPELLPKIVIFLQSEYRVLLQEALWVISNIVQGGNLHQITVLLDSGVIPPLCQHLSARDVNFVKIILETIGDLLRRCPSDFLESLCSTIEKCGGLLKIENLLQHDNEVLYELSYAITDTFFKEEEEELDEFFLAKDAATFDFKIPLI